MSNKDWSTKQITPKLDVIELVNKIPVLIPDDVRDKIRFLCKMIPKDEWSGVLFYKMTGSMKNTKTMSIELKDIHLMDKGSQAYTEFDWDESVVNYQMDNPQCLEEEWSIGHIHSHNTMQVFFSDTDWSELNDNCPLHNLYLSVIVNNYMEVVAKIAFTGISTSYICKDKDGRDYPLKLTNLKADPTMFVYDCEINMNIQSVTVPDSFSARLTAIEKQAEDKRIAKAKAWQEEQEKKKQEYAEKKYPPTHAKYLPPSSKERSDEARGYKTYDLRNKKGKRFPDYNGHAHSKSPEFDFSIEDALLDNEDSFTQQTMAQEFFTYVLRLGNNEDQIDDELIDALEDAEAADINPQSYAASIIEQYGPLYDRFFEKIPKFHSHEAFLDILEEVIMEAEGLKDDYKFLDVIIESLKAFGHKYELTFKEQEA